jgi:hypothetical protein
VTTLLAELLRPQQRENMDSREASHTTDNRGSNNSYREMEHKLNALRSLVCNLLKKNQELRSALLEAKSGVSERQYDEEQS